MKNSKPLVMMLFALILFEKSFSKDSDRITFTGEIACEAQEYRQSADGSIDSNIVPISPNSKASLRQPMIGTMNLTIYSMGTSNVLKLKDANAMSAMDFDFTGFQAQGSLPVDSNLYNGLSFFNCKGLCPYDVVTNGISFTSWDVNISRKGVGKYSFKSVATKKGLFREITGSVDCHMENSKSPIDFEMTVKQGVMGAPSEIVHYTTPKSGWAKKVVRAYPGVNFGGSNYSSDFMKYCREESDPREIYEGLH